MPALLPLVCTDPARHAEAAGLAARYGLPVLADIDALYGTYWLRLDATGLALLGRGADAPGPVQVDWTGGALGHRLRFGGGRGQPLARAIGLKGGACPAVADLTAELGRDACVLAALGCRVTLVERSPVVCALLDDGIARAAADTGIGSWVHERVQLVHADGSAWLQAAAQQAQAAPAQRPEVIYLDPMYPHREQSALVKKEMRAFRAVVGDDLDADALLAPALALATRRVVVKRPKGAPPLAGRAPSHVIASPNTRYDVYVTLAGA